MKRLLAIAACGGLMAQTAWAQSVAQPSFYSGDVAAFHGDSHTLIDAVQALHDSSGSRVVDIRFARQDGAPGFHVGLQKDGRFTDLHIDELSKRVVAIESASEPDWMLSWNKRAQLRFDRKATVSLAQAISTAEAAHDNAPAIAAGIATSASNPSSDVHAYNVILDIDGHTQRVAVDGTTGQIIANPEALSGWS
jgi:uncharacterized membrane protein YkoI